MSSGYATRSTLRDPDSSILDTSGENPPTQITWEAITPEGFSLQMEDLGLQHLWVLYLGTRCYAINDRITAWPVSALPELREELA